MPDAWMLSFQLYAKPSLRSPRSTRCQCTQTFVFSSTLWGGCKSLLELSLCVEYLPSCSCQVGMSTRLGRGRRCCKCSGHHSTSSHWSVSQEKCIVSMQALARSFSLLSRLTPHGGISASPDSRGARFDARTPALRNVKRHKIICISTSIGTKSLFRERNGKHVTNHWQCIYSFGEQRIAFAAIIALVQSFICVVLI
jgi:hypothetical protein